MKQRLQKLISAAGLASRRKSEELIKMGKVTVNGIPAALGDSADPDTDVICVDGKLLAKCEERTYIMLYKPRGYVTTLKDEKNRRCVSELVKGLGMRTSTSLSSFLGLYLNLLRSNVSVIHDTAASEVFEQIIRIGEGDLFIAISFPRYSSHTVDAMEFAKKMGAMTAAITDGPASPLNGIADVCLHAKSDMVSFLDSLVAPMSLINAIIIAVGIKNKENLSKTFERLETVWSENKVYEQTQHGGTT